MISVFYSVRGTPRSDELDVTSPVSDLEIVDDIKKLARAIGTKGKIALEIDILNLSNSPVSKFFQLHINRRGLTIRRSHRLILSILSLSEADREKVVNYLKSRIRNQSTIMTAIERFESDLDVRSSLLKDIGFSDKERRLIIVNDLCRLKDNGFSKPLIIWISSFIPACFISLLITHYMGLPDLDMSTHQQILLMVILGSTLDKFSPGNNSVFNTASYWGITSIPAQFIDMPRAVRVFWHIQTISSILKSALQTAYSQFIYEPGLNNRAKMALDSTYRNNVFFDNSIRANTSSNDNGEEEPNISTNITYDNLFEREQSKVKEKVEQGDGSLKLEYKTFLPSCNII